MAASITASIGALILTLDNPNRDDLDSVKVWVSTTSGFTPDASTLKFDGKALTVVIANLTPLVTHYVRYAYISVIDPTDYVIAAEISGTPNQIDGSLIATGAIRGKTLAGATIIDQGSTVTAVVAKPVDVVATTTIPLVDTTDFPASGAAYLLSQGFGDFEGLRYTGKTANSLTGVSGLQIEAKPGDVVLPVPYGFAQATSYAGGGTLTLNRSFMYPAAGGNGLSFARNFAAQAFTYTAGQIGAGPYTDGITGIVGLSAFSSTDARYIVHNPGFATAVLSVGALPSSFTASIGNAYLKPGGGAFKLVRVGTFGYFDGRYTSYDPVTGLVTMASNTSINLVTAGTYILVPTFSGVAIGSDLSVMAFDIDGFLFLSPSLGMFQNLYCDAGFNNAQAAQFRSRFQPPVEIIMSTKTKLQVRLGSTYPTFGTDTVTGQWGDFGVMYVPALSKGFMSYFDFAGLMTFIQDCGVDHYFSDPSAGSVTKITYIPGTTTFRFDAGGVAAGGNIRGGDLFINGTFALGGTNKGTAGQVVKSNGSASPASWTWPDQYAQSIGNQGPAFAAGNYIGGSAIAVPDTGALKAGSRYRLEIDVSKTAAGVAAPFLEIKFGTSGTGTDATLVTLTFPAQTAAVDAGRITVDVTFRAVGAGTTAVVQAVATMSHGLAATGLSTSNAPTVNGTSAGFDSTVAGSIIGVRLVAGASAAWTVSLAKATLENLN